MPIVAPPPYRAAYRIPSASGLPGTTSLLTGTDAIVQYTDAGFITNDGTAPRSRERQRRSPCPMRSHRFNIVATVDIPFMHG